MNDAIVVECPYCGETFDSFPDPGGHSQQYIEDCYVCCQPIVFDLQVDVDGKIVALSTRQENE